MDKAGYVFEKYAKLSKTQKNSLSDAIAGGLAGGIGTTLTHSLENVQISQSSKPGAALSKFTKMYNKGVKKLVTKPGHIAKTFKFIPEPLYKFLGGIGTKGISRGLPVKLMKVIPTMAITFPVYQYLSHKLSKTK